MGNDKLLMVSGRGLIVPEAPLDALLEVGKAISLVACFLFCNVASEAQPRSFTIKASENASRALPTSFRLLNSEYQEGFLVFPLNNRVKASMLNYDLYAGLLTSINDAKDTMAFNKDAAILFLSIGAEDFYHDVRKGLFKILASDSINLLTANEQLVKRPPKPTAEGYGTSTNGTTATNSSSRDADVIYDRITKYFLIDASRTIFIANKQGFYKTFRNQEDEIKVYIKKERIDFNRKEDLVKLFDHCKLLSITR